jgi:hypothetical protein
MGRLDLERAWDLLEEGDLPEALEHAERAYRRHPKDPEARFLYGHLRFVLETFGGSMGQTFPPTSWTWPAS